jgi:hypothetical protein
MDGNYVPGKKIAVLGRDALDEACLMLGCALSNCAERAIVLVCLMTPCRWTLLQGLGKLLASRFMARTTPSYWRLRIRAHFRVKALLMNLKLDVLYVSCSARLP